MVKVKICGLTGMKDILMINEVEPDFIGFVFAESQRRVTPGLVKEMVVELSPSVKRVGVFVNEDAEKVNEISESCGLDIVQLHGQETPYYCSLIKRPVWKAIRVQDQRSFEEMEQYQIDTVLLDAYSKKQYGGMGRTFDWRLAQHIDKKKKIVVAGGLNSDNVTEAIEMLKPYCVDVSSGVETGYKKDSAKIKKFIETVRFGGVSYE